MKYEKLSAEVIDFGGNEIFMVASVNSAINRLYEIINMDHFNCKAVTVTASGDNTILTCSNVDWQATGGAAYTNDNRYWTLYHYN